MPRQIMLRVFGTWDDHVKGHLHTGGPKEERATARVIGTQRSSYLATCVACHKMHIFTPTYLYFMQDIKDR
jgi:cytochrome c553